LDYWIRIVLSATQEVDTVGFNPWFVGLLDKNNDVVVQAKLAGMVSILGLLDYWIRIIPF